MKKYLVLGLVLSVLLLSSCSGCDFKGIPYIPLDSKGNLETAEQDQYSRIIDLKLTRNLSNVNLINNYNIDDYYINITTPGFIPTPDNNSLCLKEDGRFYQGDILSVTPLGGNNYTLLLDAPLDYNYSINGGCSIRDNNWAKVGSVLNPLIYEVTPAGLQNQSWDITRVMLVCRGDGVGVSNDAPDISSFFTQTDLDNGIVFRKKDGDFHNLFVARDNFHLTAEAYDLTIYPKSVKGNYGVTFRRTFNGDDKNGVVIRLNGDDEDSFQLIIRDDLSDMLECHAIAQGHVVED